MASVHDVAAYILKRSGALSTVKLQKLVYYSQAWHLVWDDEPLFEAQVEAWANGPVAPKLYQKHRGSFRVNGWKWGDANALKLNEGETVDVILSTYGKKSAQWLSELTHSEDPWREARGDLAPGERGDAVITQAAMVEYYGSLPNDWSDD
jgi:uncharacterized phage-associated protein